MKKAVEGLVRARSRWPLPKRAAAQVLGYHRVDDAGDGLCVHPTRFTTQMRILSRQRESGRAVLRLEDLLVMLRSGTAPQRSVVLTFDDGWADNHRHALVPLAEHGLPATIFIPTTFLGTHRYMSRNQVREIMAAEIDIGSHTRTHPDLRKCTPAELETELRGSKEELEDWFGVEITSFAYPSGLTNERVRAAVAAAGYRTAVSTRRGWMTAEADRYLVPRNFVEDFSDSTFLAGLNGGMNVLGCVDSVVGVLGRSR